MSARNQKALLLLLIVIGVVPITGCGMSPEHLEGVTAYDIEPGWLFSELAWSPSDDQIAATVETREENSVYLLDIYNGNHIQIQDDSDRTRYEARGAAWSNDGKSVVVFYPAAIVGPPGEPRRLTPFDIVILDASSGEVVKGVWDGTYATWGPTANSVVVVDSDIGRPREEVPVYLLDLETGEAIEIASAVASEVIVSEGLDVSPSGLLAYRSGETLQILDISTGEMLGERSVGNEIRSPAWAPDNKVLATVEDLSAPESRSYRNGIVLLTPDVSCVSEPLEVGPVIKSIDWSPNGERLVFSTNKPGKLYFLDLSVGVGKSLHDSFIERCGG